MSDVERKVLPNRNETKGIPEPMQVTFIKFVRIPTYGAAMARLFRTAPLLDHTKAITGRLLHVYLIIFLPSLRQEQRKKDH